MQSSGALARMPPKEVHFTRCFPMLGAFGRHDPLITSQCGLAEHPQGVSTGASTHVQPMLDPPTLHAIPPIVQTSDGAAEFDLALLKLREASGESKQRPVGAPESVLVLHSDGSARVMPKQIVLLALCSVVNKSAKKDFVSLSKVLPWELHSVLLSLPAVTGGPSGCAPYLCWDSAVDSKKQEYDHIKESLSVQLYFLCVLKCWRVLLPVQCFDGFLEYFLSTLYESYPYGKDYESEFLGARILKELSGFLNHLKFLALHLRPMIRAWRLGDVKTVETLSAAHHSECESSWKGYTPFHECLKAAVNTDLDLLRYINTGRSASRVVGVPVTIQEILSRLAHGMQHAEVARLAEYKKKVKTDLHAVCFADSRLCLDVIRRSLNLALHALCVADSGLKAGLSYTVHRFRTEANGFEPVYAVVMPRAQWTALGVLQEGASRLNGAARTPPWKVEFSVAERIAAALCSSEPLLRAASSSVLKSLTCIDDLQRSKRLHATAARPLALPPSAASKDGLWRLSVGGIKTPDVIESVWSSHMSKIVFYEHVSCCGTSTSCCHRGREKQAPPLKREKGTMWYTADADFTLGVDDRSQAVTEMNSLEFCVDDRFHLIRRSDKEEKVPLLKVLNNPWFLGECLQRGPFTAEESPFEFFLEYVQDRSGRPLPKAGNSPIFGPQKKSLSPAVFEFDTLTAAAAVVAVAVTAGGSPTHVPFSDDLPEFVHHIENNDYMN